MSLANFKATNHPQQTAKRGADDAVDDRGTDPAFIASLEERFGAFDMDVAAAAHNAKAPIYYTREDDGLSRPWRGLVWCNPPYSDIGTWVEKAWEEWSRNREYLVSCSLCGTPATWRINGGDHGAEPMREREALRVMGFHERRHRVRDGLNPDAFELGLTSFAPDRILMLLPANRVEQGWWQDYVEPFRDRPDSPLRVEFLRGLMRFDRPQAVIGPKGDRPPFGCALLIWSDE